MKPLLFFFSLFALVDPNRVYSQASVTYRPLTQERKVWNFRYWNVQYDRDYSQKYLYYSYFIQGDTAINGKDYKKLYMRHSRLLMYTAALRDEESRAYIVPVDSTKEFLYYDLELQRSVQLPFGLSITNFGSSSMTTSAGLTLKVREFLIPPFRGIHRWIECIGSDEDYFKCPLFGPEEGQVVAGGYGELVSCFEDGVCIYGDENGFPDTHRVTWPLTYEAKSGLTHEPSDIWVEVEEGFITFYFRNVQDHFTINGADDIYGTMFFTIPTPNEWNLQRQGISEVTYRIESEFEVFSFDIVTAIHNIPTTINHQWYDLSGRRVDGGLLPRGIYIRDGKKVVVK